MGIFSVPLFSFAEPGIGIAPGDVDVDTTPDNPQPYQDVTATISSYLTDLNKALIQWKSGSSIVLSGYGKTSYTFKTSGPNTSVTLDVIIAPAEGGDTLTKHIVITPSETELLWEAVDAYTPPFYRGKAFASREGTIRVVAIPNTSTIKSGKGNVSYTWKNKNQVIQQASGYNKDSYTFQNSEFNDAENISVTAGSVDGRYNATNSLTVPIVSPKIIFYKKSLSDGILFNQALGDETPITEDEATVVAAPYNLALKGHEGDFQYQWQINNKAIDTPSKKTELTIHPTSHGGYATINLTLENLNVLFQKVTGQLKLDL
jgi:hypothetical protein